ncbi:MAG: hypothetical protein ACETWM_12935 [Candidatus Lokiarchaeia archaeon]
MKKYYKCGKCGAPLTFTKDQKIIKCEYCNYVNEVSSIEDDMKKFMSEVKQWLSNLGAVGGEAIDATMRGVYFEDKIFPSVAVEFTNVVGDFVEPLEFPILCASFYDAVPNLQLDFMWNTDMGKPLQEFAYKLSLPDVKSFAVTSDAKNKLKSLEFRAWIIPLLLNIITLGKRDSVENYETAIKNCDRIVEKIGEIMSIVEGETKAYYDILAERFKFGAQYLKELAKKVTKKETITEEFLQKTSSNVESLMNRLMELKGAPRVDRILVEEGLKRDVESYKTFYSILPLQTLSKKPFNEFMEAFERLVENTLFNPHEEVIDRVPRGFDMTWFTGTLELRKLRWFMESFTTVLKKRSFKVYGIEEAEDWAEKNVKSPYKLFLYPFYLVRVATILKKGMLFWKKGQENAFHGLVDAAYNLNDYVFLESDFPSVLTPGFSKAINTNLGRRIEELTQLGKSAPKKDIIVLPPTVTPIDAQNLYLQSFRFREEIELLMRDTGLRSKIPSSYGRKGFDPGKVKAIRPKTEDLIYIPYALGEKKAGLAGEQFDLDQLPHRQKLAVEMQAFLEAI